MSWTASRSRANRSDCSGQSTPTGTSFIDSPVPTPRITRPGARQPRVENAWATIAGLYRNDGVRTLVPRVTPARRDRRRAQPYERVGGVAVGVAPGLEVVARPDRVEARGLRGDREVEEPPWRELLRGRLVAESEGGHVNLWRSLSGTISWTGRAAARAPSSMVNPDGVIRRTCSAARALRTRGGQRAIASAAAPTSTSTDPESRNATSRRSAASPSLTTPHAEASDDRRLAERRDDRERRPAQRDEHEAVGAERQQPADDGPGQVERLVGRRVRPARDPRADPGDRGQPDAAHRPQDPGVEPGRRQLDADAVERGVARDHRARQEREPGGEPVVAGGRRTGAAATAAGRRAGPRSGARRPARPPARAAPRARARRSRPPAAARTRGPAGRRPRGHPAGTPPRGTRSTRPRPRPRRARCPRPRQGSPAAGRASRSPRSARGWRSPRGRPPSPCGAGRRPS